MRALAIDPGSEESAWCVIDEDYRPLDFGVASNLAMHPRIRIVIQKHEPELIAIEWLQNYGMGAGATLFQTARWVGRFQLEIEMEQNVLRYLKPQMAPQLITRPQVKIHHCHSSRATDANVKQAVKDRFAPGVRNHGKGTNDQPGFFHGFSADVWEAFELAVYLIDTKTGVLV